MRIIFLFICCLFFSEAIQSQVLEGNEIIPTTKEPIAYKKHRIGLNIGGSSASGDYAEIDPSKEGSGYAEGGLSIALSYQYSFDKNFAATFYYGSGANRFNAQIYANQLAIQEPSFNWRVEANAYGVGYVMFGIKGYTGETFKVYANPMIGFGSMIAPQVDIIASDGINSISQRIRESEPSSSTMLGISFGADIKASELISINLDCSYFSSEFNIESELETFDVNGNPIVLNAAYTQPFSALNFSVGIGFHF